MSERKLVVLGAGGHGKVCAEIADALADDLAGARHRYDTIAFSDQAFERGSRVLKWTVEYHDSELPALHEPGLEFVIGMGQTGLGARREQLFTWLQGHGARIATLISASAQVSPSASIGTGSVIGNLALVQAAAAIGRNCIVNSRALVEHDARIGDHIHLSTGSIINGGASIGDRCLIGSGAIVNHGVAIGADTIIGSGAVVIRDIREPGVYAGVPARKLRNE